MEITAQLFQNLIEDSPVATLVVSGPEAHVLVANAAFCDLILHQPQELLGYSLYQVLPTRAEGFRSIIDSVRANGQPHEIKEHTFENRRNGSIRAGVMQVTYRPYHEQDDSISGVVIRCQDITEQVRAKAVLKHALEQVRLSKEAAQLGMFDFNLKENQLEWDSRCRFLFGISHQEPITYERDFVGGLHQDDRERITGIIDRLFNHRLSNGDYDVEYRTVGAEDQRVRWVRAKGKVYFNDQGEPSRFIGSVLDITEQKEMELRKNDFIGMVSHELKTPLTSLSGYVQSLLKRTEQDGQVFLHSFLEKAFTQTRKMAHMINGFLDLSRLESGKLKLEISTFDLDKLIGETAEELTPILPTFNYKYNPCGNIVVRADREKINSVIVNLLSNAVKYSPRGAEISITCREQPGEVIVSIRDNGVGIPEQELPFIFDRFYRVESHRLRHVSGFGIGLFLCAEIMRYHGGRIWAESVLGQGSTFNFALPQGDKP